MEDIGKVKMSKNKIFSQFFPFKSVNIWSFVQISLAVILAAAEIGIMAGMRLVYVWTQMEEIGFGIIAGVVLISAGLITIIAAKGKTFAKLHGALSSQAFAFGVSLTVVCMGSFGSIPELMQHLQNYKAANCLDADGQLIRNRTDYAIRRGYYEWDDKLKCTEREEEIIITLWRILVTTFMIAVGALAVIGSFILFIKAARTLWSLRVIFDKLSVIQTPSKCYGFESTTSTPSDHAERSVYDVYFRNKYAKIIGWVQLVLAAIMCVGQMPMHNMSFVWNVMELFAVSSFVIIFNYVTVTKLTYSKLNFVIIFHQISAATILTISIVASGDSELLGFVISISCLLIIQSAILIIMAVRPIWKMDKIIDQGEIAVQKLSLANDYPVGRGEIDPQDDKVPMIT